MQPNKILEKLGLAPKQAAVYGALLELGHGSGQTIALKANLAKSTTYDILKSLSRLGLVSVYLKGKKRHFTASDPGALADKIKEQSEMIVKFLPELTGLYGQRNYQPAVRFYQGQAGVGLVIKEILKEARELLAIGTAEDIFSRLTDYFPDFAEERAKKRIPIRVILRASPKAEERKKLGPEQLRQVKIVSSPILFNSLIWLWRHKIALVTLKEDLSVVVIESRELGETIQALFEIIWQCQCGMQKII